ncbi:MAG: terminase gpA endonuclease subunit, partial [Geminicoccaceae bacterium]
EREKDHGGKIHFPSWLEIGFFKELCVEVKNLKGEWENPKRFRNETWDLLVMTQAMCLETKHVGIERVDWSSPPAWAEVWDSNDLVYNPTISTKPFANKKASDYDLAELADKLA